MRPKFRELRLDQLSRTAAAFERAKTVPRPRRGWLRAIREATGMSLREVGKAIRGTPQLVASLEKSEAKNRITLHSLELVANAMGCDLIYGIVPKSGSFEELSEKQIRRKIEDDVRAVEHSMLLENQAVGRVDEKIAEETRRRIKRGVGRLNGFQ
jgi:predicted DNA-binding mobile mystery protein A